MTATVKVLTVDKKLVNQLDIRRWQSDMDGHVGYLEEHQVEGCRLGGGIMVIFNSGHDAWMSVMSREAIGRWDIPHLFLA